MKNSNCHQYVLRCYSRQLANRARAANRNGGNKEVTLSPVGKEKGLIDHAVGEIMNQRHVQTNEMCQKVLETLGEEYGEPLEISNGEGEEIEL